MSTNIANLWHYAWYVVLTRNKRRRAQGRKSRSWALLVGSSTLSPARLSLLMSLPRARRAVSQLQSQANYAD